jgi:hypothetical protein
LDLKTFKKFPIGWNKKLQADFKTLEGGENNEVKRKASRRNIERGYQKPFGRPLISRAHLHVEHPRLEPSIKKNKQRK